MICDNKIATLITPKTYRYKGTSPPIKNHIANYEVTFYITPFKSCQKWSRTDNFKKFPGILQNNKNLSAVARSGIFYVIVGNTATMTQAMKDYIFYEIYFPKLALSAPRS